MRLSLSTAAAAALFLVSASTSNAFVTPAVVSRQQFGVASPVVQLSAETTMAESGAPPATSKPSDTAEEDIPTNLPSDVGMDYVPLATMLATGQLAEADQFTRDALIVLAGSKAKGRDFVYFTEVKNIPSTDLATIERLWSKFSKGKFGYSVQKVSVQCCLLGELIISTLQLGKCVMVCV
mmetsp:Transcript_11649/g.17303  ORF Transcript_11649/g.17303 Transcript_11649/m.17303 type:complete len:180 (-) Transcript_11649:1170-1709(-)